MLSPRWHKVLADLWANKMRTILVILSVAVGVIAVGTMATSYAIMDREMNASWREINPAGGIMFTSGFDENFLASLQHVKGVGQVEGRFATGAWKAAAGDGAPTQDMYLSAVEDYTKYQLEHAFLRSGEWPGRREVALERMSLRNLPLKIGDTMQVVMPDGQRRELRVSGFVEDRAVDSGALAVQAYVTMDTLVYLSGDSWYNQVRFTAAENSGNKEHVRQVGTAIEDQFARNGGLVGATIVREPGQHPAASQSAAIMGMLTAMGALTVLLSAFLVINTIAALMAQQIRHIGVMKAVGAGSGQIFGMYVVLLLCFGLVALLIAAPLGLRSGYLATSMIAQALNFSIGQFQIETGPLALMAALSLGVPLFAGLWPVRNGARTTIRAAISGYGLSAAFGRGLVDRFFSHVRGLPRPLLMSLRNTFRRKARVILTLATLVLAGAIYMGVLSAQVSMNAGIDKLFHYFLSDVNISFDRAYRVDKMAEFMKQVPGVSQVEGWMFSSGEVLPSERGGNQVATDRITLMAPPMDSALVEREVVEGRWLLPDDQNAIVMSTTIMRAHPEWHVGSEVRLKLDTKVEQTFVIVGTFPFVSGDGNKISMASYDYLADLLNMRGQAGAFRVVTSPHDAATQDRVRDALSAEFKLEGYKFTAASGHSNIDSLGLILNTIMSFMLGMAALIAVVGGLGLAGAMSMNVMERTREIGVMRSIGAANGAVMQLVIVEGVLIGVLSWMAGAFLSIPIGELLASQLGNGLFGMPFALIFNWSGLSTWLVIVIVLSVIASALPAWNAARLTVREVLAYE